MQILDTKNIAEEIENSVVELQVLLSILNFLKISDCSNQKSEHSLGEHLGSAGVHTSPECAGQVLHH